MAKLLLPQLVVGLLGAEKVVGQLSQVVCLTNHCWIDPGSTFT